MPVPPDHAIANRVRAILYRWWIDLRSLDYGSVNGVVYVRGELRRSAMFPSSRREEEGEEELRLVQGLARELLAIPGVKDLSFELNGLEQGGDHWEHPQLRTA